MGMLVLLLASVVYADHSNYASAPASDSFPFEDIKDPNAQCVDIKCFEPIKWNDNKKEVCRSTKARTCKPVQTEVCIDVPETECEIVGYTECSSDTYNEPSRDDRVVGEYFYEQECTTKEIEITEVKKHPHCVNMTKNLCEKQWIPEAPYWKDVNCQEKTWQNCTLVPHPAKTTIQHCACKPKEIWYNKFERRDTQCEKKTSSCVPKAVPVCKTKPVKKCTKVSWEECTETCKPECTMMHFKEPSQKEDHRRWCSHAEIILPPGVNRVPATVGVKREAKPATKSASSATVYPTSKITHPNPPATNYVDYFKIANSPPVYTNFNPVAKRQSNIAPKNFHNRQGVKKPRNTRG